MNREPIFDAVRRLLDRSLRQPEVDTLDEAIDEALGLPTRPDAPSAPEAEFSPASIGSDGIALIKRFEGCARKRSDGKIEAYPDPGSGGDPWTIGWGATGPGIERGTVWTQAQCDQRLVEDLVRYGNAVKAALGPDLAGTSQAQFDAMVSFHYNTGAIGRATLTKKHKAGDFLGAEAEFARWNKAAGRVMQGLVRRREAEAALYRKGS